MRRRPAGGVILKNKNVVIQEKGKGGVLVIQDIRNVPTLGQNGNFWTK